tara:strand:+ start:119 stop:1093 length:975 start_codon:yes stop_codon:yes gene_type:complete
MLKNNTLGTPEYSGERKTNEIGDEFTGVYEFKDKNRQKHFRLHKVGTDRLDSKEAKTIWHSEMQARFIRLDPKFRLEVHYLGSEGNRRQADIVYDDKVCIELQHSSISKNELEERTRDALHKFEKVIWVFDHKSMISKSSKWLEVSNIAVEEEEFKPINYTERTRLEDALYHFEQRWGQYGVQVDLTNVKSYSAMRQEWEFSTCFGAEPAETVYFRSSTPPVYMYLNTLPRESLFKGYNIKDYGTDVSDERVSILFHYYEAPFDDEEEPYEIFHKLEKGLTRQEAKKETLSEDFQKRLPYVTKHKALSWDMFCCDEISKELIDE